MRDPNRIEPFMQELGKIWKEECPDQRFGQFICNTFDMMSDVNIFYVEDDRMLMHVKKVYNKGKGRRKGWT